MRDPVTTTRMPADAGKESRFRAQLLDQVDAAVVATDLGGHVTHWNLAAERLYGWTAEEMIGRSISRFAASPESAARESAMLEAAIRAGGWHGQLDRLRKDGTTFPAYLRVSTLTAGDDDIPSGLVGVSIDIASRVRIERDLRSARDYLHAVTQSMGEGLCTVDETGRISYLNEAAERMLGWTTAELLGRRFHETKHYRRMDGSHFPASECPLVQARAERHFVRVDDDVFIRKDGTSLPVAYTSAPIEIEEGVHGAVIVFSDISDRKRAEAERQAMEPELRMRQKMEAVGQLAAGIAHEINTPIQYVGDTVRFLQDAFTDLMDLVEVQSELYRAAVAGTVDEQLLERVRQAQEYADVEYLNERAPVAFDRTHDGIRRVARIVRAMRELTHPPSSARELIDLNEAVQTTLVVSANAYKYIADVKTDLGVLPSVLCHGDDVNQVLLNLIVNAAHAIEEVVGDSGRRGEIRIRTRSEGDQVVISIADTGNGIPDDVAGRVFDPFFTTKQIGKGTGQGLAIARTMIVERHGGSLTFETEPGQGTTFVIGLPLAVDEPATSAKPATA
jgi:PAS domain S-box-containing protein